MSILGINNQITFQRRPTKEEEPGLQKACNEAYNAIGVKERCCITHGSCFPADGRNTYSGSPYGKSAKNWINFLMLYGFNCNQLGPGGSLEKNADGIINPSPYNSSAFAKNKLFIDLEELTTNKYGNILSETTYNKLTELPHNSNKNYDMSDFDKAEKIYDYALKEAYDNFTAGLKAEKPEIIVLNNEFMSFRDRHDERLTDEALYKIFEKKYQDNNSDNWPEKDSNLLTDIRNGELDAIEYYNDLVNDNNETINEYKFEQFIATKQIKENKEWRDKYNFKYINDLLVGCSQMDKWRYKEAFLNDWEMGARENSGKSQRWHIPVIDPKKIFKQDNDSNLNVGGKFLKEKINFALEFCENIRIDHAMGLIEPYLLSKNAKDSEFSDNNNKNTNVEKYLSQLRDSNGNEYDKYWDYPNLLKKLVIPTLKEHKISVDLPVWEDICSYPPMFIQIYEKDLNLPKIQNLDWNRAQDLLSKGRENDWYLIGSHDNVPAMTYMHRIGTMKDGTNGEYTREAYAWDSNYLAGYLNIDDSRKNINEIRKELSTLYNTNDRERIYAKFAELMTTPKFQISFADLLGITDVTYNIGGSSRKENWKERISADFLDKYYQNLSSENPTALNIPELLKKALIAKIDMQVQNTPASKKTNVRNNLDRKYKPLLDELQKYADILKEPENK